MNRIALTSALIFLLATVPALAQEIEVARVGAQPSSKGSADTFAGAVRVDPLFAPKEPSRVSGGQVTFEPGARTAWHGATPTTWMTHIAIQEQSDGKVVNWMEKVGDAPASSETRP